MCGCVMRSTAVIVIIVGQNSVVLLVFAVDFFLENVMFYVFHCYVTFCVK